MLRFLAKLHSNAAVLENIKKKEANNEEKFSSLKKVQKLLGQADKKNPGSYTSLPNTLSGLEKSAPPGKLDEIMQNLEIKMYCKDALNSIIKEVEGNDANEIARCMVNEVVNSTFEHLHLRCQKVLNPKKRSTAGKKMLMFQMANKTWKERSVIMYFFLHDCLGAKNLGITAKAFATSKSTISTWYNEKKYWGKFLPFLDDLNMKDVVASIKNVELRDVYSSHGDALDSDLGQLNLQKFEGWKDEKFAFTGGSGVKKLPLSRQKKNCIGKKREKQVSLPQAQCQEGRKRKKCKLSCCS